MSKFLEEYSSYKINKELYLVGTSLAGTRTSFILKPYNILFDFGIENQTITNICFLTHQHSDHSFFLGHLLSKRRKHHKSIFLPEESFNDMINYHKYSYRSNHPEINFRSDEEFLSIVNCTYIPVKDGDIITEKKLNLNNNGIHAPFQVEVLKGYHTCQVFGYGFTKISKHLKPEYMEMSKNDPDYISKFKKMKADGIDIKNEHFDHVFAFFCDSTIHNLTNETSWKLYPVIICECTCMVETDDKNDIMIKRGHTTLNQLLNVIKDNKDKKWIIIHTSKKHTSYELIEIEGRLINEGYDVTIVHDR